MKTITFPTKHLSEIFFLLFNVLIWYYMISGYINSFSGVSSLNDLSLWGAFYVSIVLSSFLGSYISKKLDFRILLKFWIILGALSSLSPLLLDVTISSNLLFISILLGASFGIGMPSCLAFFGDSTQIEGRGKIAGLTFLLTSLCAPIFAIIILNSDLTISTIFLAFWRGSGLLFFLIPHSDRRFSNKDESDVNKETRSRMAFKSVFRDKTFLLYFLAWFMFCCVDKFEKPILQGMLETRFFNSMLVTEALIGSVAALVGGWLSDSIGRKRVVIYGFAALGLGYAVIGIIPGAPISWYFYFVVDGISAGIFFALYVLILWGDLSPLGAKENYYTVGSIPYFIVPLIPQLMFTYRFSPEANTAFSLASFFLFLAVIPLLYAPETLPEKHIERKRLRSYVEKALSVKEKKGY